MQFLRGFVTLSPLVSTNGTYVFQIMKTKLRERALLPSAKTNEQNHYVTQEKLKSRFTWRWARRRISCNRVVDT